jgi:hypothetical protein
VRIGLGGGAYTDTSLAFEECINMYRTQVESQGAVTPGKAYGGSMAQSTGGLKGAPGLSVYYNSARTSRQRAGMDRNTTFCSWWPQVVRNH